MLSVSTGVHWRYRYSNFPSYFFDGGPSTTTQVSIVILSKVDKWDSNINETLHVCSIQLKPFQCLNISIWKYVWPRMQQLKQLWMYLMWQFYFERSTGYYYQLTSRCILKSRLSILNSSWTKIYVGLPSSDKIYQGRLSLCLLDQRLLLLHSSGILSFSRQLNGPDSQIVMSVPMNQVFVF